MTERERAEKALREAGFNHVRTAVDSPSKYRRCYPGDVFYGCEVRVGTEAATIEGTIPLDEFIRLLTPQVQGLTERQKEAVLHGMDLIIAYSNAQGFARELQDLLSRSERVFTLAEVEEAARFELCELASNSTELEITIANILHRLKEE